MSFFIRIHLSLISKCHIFKLSKRNDWKAMFHLMHIFSYSNTEGINNHIYINICAFVCTPGSDESCVVITSRRLAWSTYVIRWQLTWYIKRVIFAPDQLSRNCWTDSSTSQASVSKGHSWYITKTRETLSNKYKENKTVNSEKQKSYWDCSEWWVVLDKPCVIANQILVLHNNCTCAEVLTTSQDIKSISD